MITGADLAALLPHAGAMCLLDAVLSFSDAQIACRANSHRDPANPLRHRGRLGILCGAEYAGQAMALHGALLARSAGACSPGPCYLAALRDVACHAVRLDDLPGPLVIAAEPLQSSAALATYAFVLRHAEQVLLTGRASVVRRPGGGAA